MKTSTFIILTILKRYWFVTIFKETPANTPCSWSLLMVASALYFCILICQWSISNARSVLLTAALAGAMLQATYFIYTYILLKLYKKEPRFLQTTICLLMSTLLIHLLALPLVILNATLLTADTGGVDMLLLAILYFLLALSLSVWQFLAIAHIYRQALASTVTASLLASFGLLASIILTVSFWR